ncbi:MAG: hypothetical protein JJE17_05790 [Peptostreptococcaceae bacterium]|nr:hypothetical protein [Peptostreptococcaceae bacterium]
MEQYSDYLKRLYLNLKLVKKYYIYNKRFMTTVTTKTMMTGITGLKNEVPVWAIHTTTLK